MCLDVFARVHPWLPLYYSARGWFPVYSIEKPRVLSKRLTSPVSPLSDYCEDWPEAQRISASLLDSRSYETLVDFDNHLDDIRNDWTNPEINKAVLHLC